MWGIPVDVSAQVPGYPLLVYFTHIERPIPDELLLKLDGRGLVAISLDETHTLFDRQASSSYIERLRTYQSKDIACKKWIYHPRQSQVKREAIDMLNLLPGKQPLIWPRVNLSRQGHHKPIMSMAEQALARQLQSEDSIQDEKVIFQCQMCKSAWKGYRRSGKQCSRCGTAIYSIEIDH